MRITVIIPSRKRVRGLSATLTTLSSLASRKHDISYGVCCDKDDQETQDFCENIKREINVSHMVGPRPKALGELYNRMAVNMPAELYFLLVDDMLCLTPDWDHIAARACVEKQHGVFFWTSALKQEALWAIITEKWRAAAGGLFTDFFPFWYDDLAIVEQYIMATDDKMQVLPILAADRLGGTNRMRDLPFWQEFYVFTRQYRVERGKEIAKNLGMPQPKYGANFARLLNEKLSKPPTEWLEKVQNNQGDSSEPDPSYLVAKARAEQWMATGIDPMAKAA